MLKTFLEHPLTRGVDLNNPRMTFLRRRIIEEKPFLRQIYEEWYRLLAEALPTGREPVLEIGSGAGFLSNYIPDLITSEVFPIQGVRVILNGSRLPFRNSSLRGIVMTDVLHHVPQPRSFFAEAARCVRPGGVIAMIEPWVSTWSKLVYRNLHHEPFMPETIEWEFPSSGPLSGANGALPWIIFERDRKRFEREFPEWRIHSITPFMPFRYLVSGGVSLRSLMPGVAFGLARRLEQSLQSRMNTWAMFAMITLERNAVTAKDH
ncbi:MAG TPA: class I SAM-dependent methyltransferase [Blastocatellia bacterium]|nr:class I SAM-dependent methyltransferase [Blastocatellia bacterium]